jgi:ABC-type branched-subunit amino acid transport system substrate-binding protein
MKKIFLIIALFISSCKYNDLKLTQDFNDEENEVVEYNNKTTKIETPPNKEKSIVEQNKLNKKEGDYNFLNQNNEDELKLSEEEKQYLKPKIGRNFESNNLQIPPSSNRKIQVALFLPLSGKNKDLGLSLFNTASLSLFENDFQNKIELVLFDSKDTTQENQKAFKEIIDSKIKVVIGPIFSTSVIAIEKMARDNDITVISLSNNHELLNKTDSDGGVFIGGILPESQIDKIVNYSMDQGKLNFAVIAPNNQYGKVITEYLKKFVRARDGNFITSEFYEANNRDIDRATERVINSFGVPTKSKNRDTSYLSDYDRIYPQVILIPESGKMLSKLVNSINKLNKDERDFKLIGTSQWSEASTLKDINLLGSWFPAPEDNRFRIFEKKYYDSFGKFPPRISSIVYDSVLAIAKIAQNKNNLKINFSDFIEFNNAPKNGFDGIDGVFRFLPNGAVQRNLAILQVGNGKFETLDSSIEKFLKY